MLTVHAFSYRYPNVQAHRASAVLKLPALNVAQGDIAWLAGESGCGKTTALNLISGILAPPPHVVHMNARDIGLLSALERDRWRAQSIGFIPQEPLLIDSLTALQNVSLPLALAGNSNPLNALDWLDKLGLSAVSHHKPAQLSRGQQQRVAIARAFAAKPMLILADEPTANLDDTQANSVMGLLQTLCLQHNCAALIASHDARIAPFCTQKVRFA